LRQPVRQLADSRWHIGSRKARGEQGFDFALTLAGYRLEELGVILFGQSFPQHLEGRKVDSARGEQRIDGWKPSSETRRENASKCLAVAEPELLGAEREHRRKAGLEVKAALFDFCEVSHELCRNLVVRTDELPDVREQLLIGAMAEFHSTRIAR
jgi:hypothetical protein